MTSNYCNIVLTYKSIIYICVSYLSTQLKRWPSGLRRLSGDSGNFLVVGGNKVDVLFIFIFAFGEKNFLAKLHVTSPRGKDLK